MIKISYPVYEFKIITEAGVRKIFDKFRKIWCVLTPEEWVRQHMLIYLNDVLKYPASLFSIEKEINLGELKKRCDIIVYNQQTKPWMIIECKERKVNLNGNVLDQVLRYHTALPCKYIVITNGDYTYGFEKESGIFKEINALPSFEV